MHRLGSSLGVSELVAQKKVGQEGEEDQPCECTLELVIKYTEGMFSRARSK